MASRKLFHSNKLNAIEGTTERFVAIFVHEC